MVLVGVAYIADDSDQLIDAGRIGLIVLLSAELGFTQNYRANRGIESLSRPGAPSATVLRDGVPDQVDASLLVPGDVVLLAEGARIPADGRLLRSVDLRVDESALTGESAAASKRTHAAPAGAALADHVCMVYSGTVVVRGRGRLLVTATGMQTELGLIAAEVQTPHEEPIIVQREVGRLAC